MISRGAPQPYSWRAVRHGFFGYPALD
uniref:Uncharacterized protein n=1 Tax=Anguilla anguilla TaxID=7936 RepID=A0A0E9QK42_ANGAN